MVLAQEHLHATLKALVRKPSARACQGLSPQIESWIKEFQWKHQKLEIVPSTRSRVSRSDSNPVLAPSETDPS
jgi:hypothetical protein